MPFPDTARIRLVWRRKIHLTQTANTPDTAKIRLYLRPSSRYQTPFRPCRQDPTPYKVGSPPNTPFILPIRDEALYRFRYRIYCEEAYIDPIDHPQGKFSDNYEQASASVIALADDVIVGAGRATHMSAAGLPTLQYFNVVLPDGISDDTLVEMGRFMIDRRFRGRSRIVSQGLVVQLRAYLDAQPSVQWLIAFMSRKVCRAFAPFVAFEALPEHPLQQRHLDARRMLPGYWRQADIHPYIARASALLGTK